MQRTSADVIVAVRPEPVRLLEAQVIVAVLVVVPPSGEDGREPVAADLDHAPERRTRIAASEHAPCRCGPQLLDGHPLRALLGGAPDLRPQCGGRGRVPAPAGGERQLLDRDLDDLDASDSGHVPGLPGSDGTASGPMTHTRLGGRRSMAPTGSADRRR